MNGIVQAQAQRMPRLPLDVMNESRRSIVIDLVSDDGGSEEVEDYYELEGEYLDAPEEPIRPQHPVVKDEYQQAGARPKFMADRMEFRPFDAFPPVRQDSPRIGRNEIWGDYIIADDFDAEEFAQVIDLEQDSPSAAQRPPAPPGPPGAPRPQTASLAPAQIQREQQLAAVAEVVETQDECIQTVVTVFPGICADHVSELYNNIAKSSDRLIAHILDQMDKGILYPKAKDKAKDLKRKRAIDADEEAARKYGAPDRIIPAHVGGIRPYIRNILSHEFPETPMSFIDASLSQSGHRLFSAYQLLDEANRTYDPATSGYVKIKNPRKQHTDFREENIEILLSIPNGDLERAEVLRELRAARRVKTKAEARRQAERAAQIEEQENEAKAQAEGTMSECGCCFGDYPLNRMVHCDGEPMHWFCRVCALRNAETEVGQSKYELCCMSMDVCNARFTVSQRDQFLDEKTKIALERNEQEANLRLAGIENLASCPFCPYAAEYPPVEVDREFRCQAPDCEKVSCRLCKLESHIPKSCDENAKETGLSVRRHIEEAMSAALIRKCNKCGTPFIKEEGCNKMRCTLKGCGNVQCYVCSKSCDYDHFNDEGRGGKPGNCPLFESVETRHDEEVSKAEKEALDKIRAEYPEYTEDDLKVKVSEVVKKDDERRRARDPRINGAMGARAVGAHGVPIHAMRLYEFLPMNHAAMRQPGQRAAPDAPPPYYPPPLVHHHHHHVPDPYLRLAEAPANANTPDAMEDEHLNDFEIFNHIWGEAFPPPPPPQGPPPIPDLPAAGIVANPHVGARPPLGLHDLVMRYPRNHPPHQDHAVEAQKLDWGDVAEGYQYIGRGVPEQLDPLPEFRSAAENSRQRDNQLMIDAMQERMAERMRRRAQVENGNALNDDDLLWPAIFGRQAQAAAVQATAMQHERTNAEAEVGRQSFGMPPVPQMPTRNDYIVDGIQVGVDHAVSPGQENDAERSRQPKDRLGRMAGNLEVHSEERRRLLSERLGRLRAAAQDHEEEGRRLTRANLDRMQIKAHGRDVAHDEELRAMNEQIGRLRAQRHNVNAAEPARGRNDVGEGRRGLFDRFRGQTGHIQAAEPGQVKRNEVDSGQNRDRMWLRFGKRHEDPPAEVLRQQQILEHEERKIRRSQQIARLRREQEHDEAATARRLEILRQNNAIGGVENEPPVDMSFPEPEEYEDSDDADGFDDEDEFEDGNWF